MLRKRQKTMSDVVLLMMGVLTNTRPAAPREIIVMSVHFLPDGSLNDWAWIAADFIFAAWAWIAALAKNKNTVRMLMEFSFGIVELLIKLNQSINQIVVYQQTIINHWTINQSINRTKTRSITITWGRRTAGWRLCVGRRRGWLVPGWSTSRWAALPDVRVAFDSLDTNPSEHEGATSLHPLPVTRDMWYFMAQLHKFPTLIYFSTSSAPFKQRNFCQKLKKILKNFFGKKKLKKNWKKKTP